MERILVIGCPGAGKSSFARRLREITGLPLHYLDMIWHRPDRTTVAREEFDRRLEQILQTDRWIIDGNYQRTMARRLEECDTVFLLDIPVEICLEGAKERIGRQREDLPCVENELEKEFRQWIEEFPPPGPAADPQPSGAIRRQTADRCVPVPAGDGAVPGPAGPGTEKVNTVQTQSRAAPERKPPGFGERESGVGYRMRTRMMPGTAARSCCKVSGTAPVASSMV